MAVHAAITIVLVLLIPNTTDLAHVHARSAGEFVGTLFLIAAWPLHRPWLLLTHATLIAVSLRTLLAARSVRDGGWRLLAVGLWLGLQFAALAYSRARGVPLSSRYLDTMVIGQIAGVVAAGALVWSPAPAPRHRVWRWCAVAAWLVVIVLADWSHARHELSGPIHQRHDSAVLQARTLHAYLAEGDAAALSGQPADRLPYPDPIRLRRLLDDSSIRAVLPPALTRGDGAATPERGATALKAALLGARAYLACGGGWWRPARPRHLHAVGAGR